MRNKTGYSNETKKHMLLGAGAIFKNFNVGTDTYENARNKIIGATQGGNEFKAVASVRPIQVDGIIGKAVELDSIDSWDVSLTVNFIEANIDVIKAALGAADVDTSDDAYDHITGRTEFIASDYFENITFIGTIAGAAKPVIIQVRNSINTGGLNVKCQDTAEGTIQVVFEGRITVEGADEAPFDIYYPKMLKASADSVSITGTGNKTVALTGAQGTVTVASSNAGVCTASISTNTITITGVAAGKAIVTATDTDGNKVQIKVTVA